MRAERTFSNEVLGLRGTILEDGSGNGGELAQAEVRARAGGNGGPPHIHLRQEERFVITEGRLAARRGRERLELGPGEDVRIPAGTAHTFEALTDAVFVAEFRPALRVADFFEALFALPLDKRGNPRPWDAARLQREFPDEFLYFPVVPVTLQRALAVPLAALSRRQP
jgi:mannose-6-phosphate isomerase-like protein (cupin superfamily)